LTIYYWGFLLPILFEGLLILFLAHFSISDNLIIENCLMIVIAITTTLHQSRCLLGLEKKEQQVNAQLDAFVIYAF